MKKQTDCRRSFVRLLWFISVALTPLLVFGQAKDKAAWELVKIGQKESEVIYLLGVPDYVEVDQPKMKGTFKRIPALADVPFPVKMEPHLVVEFYSR